MTLAYLPTPAQIHAHRLTGTWRVQSLSLDAAFSPESLKPDWHEIAECAHIQTALYPDQPYWGDRLRAVNEQAWIYQRTFTVPDTAYRRARLHFEGVDYFAEVWLNGSFVGRHEGHFAPFTFDVTPYLNRADNTLTVRVTSPWDAPNSGGVYPTDHVVRGLVKGLYEHGEGVIPPNVNPLGIWRPVWLLLDQGVSVDQVRIRTCLDGTVDACITMTNSTADGWQGALALSVKADNHDGGGVQLRTSVSLPPGTHVVERTLHIPDVRLWWSWDQGFPALYTLDARLIGADGVTLDTRRERFGVRTIRLERTPERLTYYLNERPIFIRGSAYMPALYLSQVNETTLARDLDLARAANLNLLRVHVHVSPPELYALCDAAGMLVWQDFELNWVQDSSPEFERRARALQRAMIDLLANHPAIITWACHNEPTMIFLRRDNLERSPDPALYADVQELDPTRPAFICSGQMDDDWQRSGDSHSYYGAIWSPRYTDIYRQRPHLNTEFGFEAPAAIETLRAAPEVWQRLDHLEGEIDGLWAYQAALIQYHVEHFRRLRATGCAGYVHFWLADLVPQVGCGVLDSARLPKGGYDALRRASAPLHVALEHDGRRPIALWVFNDTQMAYTGAVLRWHIFDAAGGLRAEGETTADIAANGSQRIIGADWTISPADCAAITLTLHAADGQTLCANRYEHPFQPLPRPRGYPWKFDPYLATKVFDRPGAPSLNHENRDSARASRSIHWNPLASASR